jgi:hypothetical protein
MLITYLQTSVPYYVKFRETYHRETLPEDALNEAKKSLSMSCYPGARVVVENAHVDAPVRILGYSIKMSSTSWSPNEMTPMPKWYNAWGEEVKVDKVRVLQEDCVDEVSLCYYPVEKYQETSPITYPKRIPPLKKGYAVYPAYILDYLLKGRMQDFRNHASVILMEDKNEVIFREDFKYTGWTHNTDAEDRGKPFPKSSMPGLYTIEYLDKYGEVYCAACATAVWARFLAGDMTSRMEEMIHGHGTYDEGPDIECCNCATTLESSYGDPTVEEVTNDKP